MQTKYKNPRKSRIKELKQLLEHIFSNLAYTAA